MHYINTTKAIIILDYKHISFDVWLTLIKSNPEFKSKRNQLFKSYFEIKEDILLISEKIRYYDLLCNSINEKIGKNIDTFEIYLLILQSLNVDINPIDFVKLQEFYFETEKLFLKHEPILIDKNCYKTFEYFQKKSITMNILSNTGFIRGLTMKKLFKKNNLEAFFSFQIYSDECNLSKPNPQIFELVFENTKKITTISKSEILHIGDNPVADYNAAINFGFNSLLFKN